MKNYLAIDIGGTYIKFVIIDNFGEIQETQKVESPKTLTELKRRLTEIIISNKSEISGVGISCPGKVDSQTGIIYHGGALPFMHEFSIVEFVEKNFGLHCAVCNDGKAAALSELWLGNLKGEQNAAAIVLGTGVGGGIIINGDIFQGENFQAGELSFIPSKSTSGETEDLIGYTASAVQFIQRGAKILSLTDLNDGPKVFDALAEGNRDVMSLFQSYCREVVHIILTLQAILDIKKIVIGGGISQQPQLILQIRKEYDLFRSRVPIVEKSIPAVLIEKCKFGNEANLLGAIYMLLLKIDGS